MSAVEMYINSILATPREIILNEKIRTGFKVDVTSAVDFESFLNGRKFQLLPSVNYRH